MPKAEAQGHVMVLRHKDKDEGWGGEDALRAERERVKELAVRRDGGPGSGSGSGSGSVAVSRQGSGGGGGNAGGGDDRGDDGAKMLAEAAAADALEKLVARLQRRLGRSAPSKKNTGYVLRAVCQGDVGRAWDMLLAAAGAGAAGQ